MLTVRRHLDARSDDGFSLIELLVVMVIFTIVGAIVSNGIITALQVSRRGQARVETLAELQKGVERMSRELRAADPIEVADPDQVRVVVERGGEFRRFTYTLASGAVTERRETSPDGSTWTTVYDGRFLEDIVNTTIFTYATAEGGAPGGLADIGRITITLERDLPEQDSITVETLVAVRNS